MTGSLLSPAAVDALDAGVLLPAAEEPPLSPQPESALIAITAVRNSASAFLPLFMDEPPFVISSLTGVSGELLCFHYNMKGNFFHHTKFNRSVKTA